MSTRTEGRFDAVESRFDSIIERYYTPYAGLAVGAALTPFILDEGIEFWLVTGGLVAAGARFCSPGSRFGPTGLASARCTSAGSSY